MKTIEELKIGKRQRNEQGNRNNETYFTINK